MWSGLGIKCETVIRPRIQHLEIFQRIFQKSYKMLKQSILSGDHSEQVYHISPLVLVCQWSQLFLLSPLNTSHQHSHRPVDFLPVFKVQVLGWILHHQLSTVLQGHFVAQSHHHVLCHQKRTTGSENAHSSLAV